MAVTSKKPGPRPVRPENTVEVRLRLDPVLHEQLKKEAENEQRSMNVYIERILIRRSLAK